MAELDFNSLPCAVSSLTEMVRELNRKMDLLADVPRENKKTRVSLEEACEMYDLKKPTFYSYVSNGLISPIKIGRRNFFQVSDLEEFFLSKRKKTKAEIAAEVDQELKNRKRL